MLRPSNAKLPKNSAMIINTMRDEIGGDFGTIVPLAHNTLESINAIGNVILTNPMLMNQFASALVNKIGLTIISSKMYQNPWAALKRGILETGDTIEEIFVDRAEAHQYDPVKAVNELFKRELPDISTAYHRLNYAKFYKRTIGRRQLQLAFQSVDGVANLATAIIESMFKGANQDEFIVSKYLVAKMALRGNITPVQVPVMSSTTAKEVVTMIKTESANMTYMNGDRNVAGVETSTNYDDQIIIMDTKFEATVDVEVLAAAFNMDKATFMGNRVGVNSFSFSNSELNHLDELFLDIDYDYTRFTAAELAELKNIQCLLIDRDWFMIFDNLNETTEQQNPQALEEHHFLHQWKTFSVSPYAQANVFVSIEPTVTAITITPSTASVMPGNRLKFTETVETTGLAPQGVEWDVFGADSEKTIITPDGVLSVAGDETATTLTVRATSRFDESIEAVASVTIVQ